MLLPDTINAIYDFGHSPKGVKMVNDYHRRHDTQSQLVLTCTTQDDAETIAKELLPHIQGKRVIEIGAGVGLVAIEIAKYAEHVIAIESDPGWSWAFTKYLWAHKPANLSWIFGRAEDFIGMIRADVAIIITHSGRERMIKIAYQMAPRVIALEKS